jgi:uncharacterized protein (TIGR03435 family)
MRYFVFLLLFAWAPSFEVASVKALPEPGRWVSPRVINPQLVKAQTVLERLISWAYHVSDFQVVGGPAWILQDRYDLQATAERPSNEDEMREMMRGLLAERFGVKLHREMREVPVYALVVGKNGLRMKEAENAAAGSSGEINIRPGDLVGSGATMELLCRILTDNLERPVVDETGLTGHYDFRVSYEPPAPPPGNTWAPMGASIFVPIQDIGLRLEPRRERVEILPHRFGFAANRELIQNIRQHPPSPYRPPLLAATHKTAADPSTQTYP